jgi:hypothetical protein
MNFQLLKIVKKFGQLFSRKKVPQSDNIFEDLRDESERFIIELSKKNFDHGEFSRK